MVTILGTLLVHHHCKLCRFQSSYVTDLGEEIVCTIRLNSGQGVYIGARCTICLRHSCRCCRCRCWWCRCCRLSLLLSPSDARQTHFAWKCGLVWPGRVEKIGRHLRNSLEELWLAGDARGTSNLRWLPIHYEREVSLIVNNVQCVGL